VDGSKTGPAKWFAREFGGRLWQQGFNDRILHTEEAVAATIAYVVENPVRAGFVTTPYAWPFIGSSRRPREEVIAAAMRSRRSSFP
jgi:hypothetical protein